MVFYEVAACEHIDHLIRKCSKLLRRIRLPFALLWMETEQGQRVVHARHRSVHQGSEGLQLPALRETLAPFIPTVGTPLLHADPKIDS